MSVKDVLTLIAEKKVTFVDFRFADTQGRDQHVTVPASIVDENFFKTGKMFDGSSIAGWKGIEDSDMVLMPDPATAVIDPFFQDTTLLLRCDVLNPGDMQGYHRDPRTIGQRAEKYLQSLDIADAAYFGPEAEFFVFDGVRWNNEMKGSFFEIESSEARWNSGKDQFEEGNKGHRPDYKGGYMPVPPVDAGQDLRSAMCLAMQEMGLTVETHHHEVATGGQAEIGIRFNTLVAMGDDLQTYKYCVRSVADSYGMTATFMPKPLVGDNGSGMHVHQSLMRDGKPVFAGDEYAGLSRTALHYIGGVFKHARAINALANPSTNSYKRLVPGFEAPVMLAYSAVNRSASCRIPHVASSKARRIEIRFPDPSANPYLTFTAMLMAGLDGIRNEIDPGKPIDKNLYDLPKEITRTIPTVAHSLEQALEALDKDRGFLKAGDVMTDDFIDSYLELKQAEVDRLRLATHPVEFDMYYSC